jgi:hypothetical protein
MKKHSLSKEEKKQSKQMRALKKGKKQRWLPAE